MLKHLIPIALGTLMCGATQVHAQTLSPTEAAWRISSRLGYGPSPDMVASIQQAGSAQLWAVQQLRLAQLASQQPAKVPASYTHFNQPLSVIFPAFESERQARKAGQEKLQKPDVASMGVRRDEPALFSRDASREAAAWRVTACSQPDTEHPLLARMTEFWFNHLNVFAGKGAVRPFVGHYELNVIRKHALGKFEDLLLASAQHPAMLFYLDQAQSVADGSNGPNGQARGLNENYARELMELHTLGVNGGYTQRDVRELARILTGWTVAPKHDSGFRFNPRTHDGGDKLLLGTTYRNQGVEEGEAAIRQLARHPATAQRIATRLVQFFVSDQPNPALVHTLSNRFKASQGNMRVVMQALVESDAFWERNASLFKTPYDFACSALLALNQAPVRQRLAQALQFLNQAGQPVHGWQTPDGYPTDATTWMSPEALTRRADFAMALARQQPPPEHLNAFLSSSARARIGQEPVSMQAGLMLASPDFMRK